jgi:hypothetical protein
MKIYIDESGNLGQQGRFFIITCLAPRNHKRLTNLAKNCRVKFGNGIPLKELKGHDMNFPQKQYFINRLISINDFNFSYIVADKKHLNKELFERKNICFNYLVAHLLKTIIKSTNEDIEIVCDNRDIKVASGKSLQDYLQLEAYSKWGFKHHLCLSYVDSASHNHIQCVDIISNIISGRYMLNFGHFYKLILPFRRHHVRFPYQLFGS